MINSKNNSFYNFDLNSKFLNDEKNDENIKKKNKIRDDDLYLKNLSDNELLEEIKKDKMLLLNFEHIDKEELKRRRNIYDNYIFSKIGFEIKDPYVKVYNNSIPYDLCDEIIRRFDNDSKPIDGVTSLGLNRDVKRTKDLMLSKHSNWKDIDEKMYKILNVALNDYIKYLSDNDLDFYYSAININEILDKGYNIQKYNQNDGFYIWHTDDMVDYDNQEARVLTYLWYLNTVEEGGETYFKDFKIKPEKGKLIFFPATWTYIHRAAVPRSSDKYIVTGWIAEKRSLIGERMFNESIEKEDIL
jgi:hypothetical protein